MFSFQVTRPLLATLSCDTVVAAIAAGRTYVAESSQLSAALSASGGGATAGSVSAFGGAGHADR
ncbi:MAG: hypothetical protein J2P28_03970 [Actinobacteria bacterium]|nr:hypothetical protein [Actinomycetota bacterium]